MPKPKHLFIALLWLLPSLGRSQNATLETLSDSLNNWMIANPEYVPTANEYFQLAQKKNDQEHLGRAYLYLGSIELWEADYDSARIFLGKGLEYETTYRGRLNLGMGLSYSWSEDYVRGFTYFKEAAQHLGDDDARMARTYNNMAIALKVQKDYKGARTYFRRARELQHKMGNRIPEANFVLNYALTYSSEKQKDSVKMYLDTALMVLGELKAPLSRTGIYSALIGYHKSVEDYDQALACVDSAKIYCELLGNPSYRVCGVLIHEIELYLDLKEFDKAENALLKMENYVDGANSNEILIHYHMLKSRIAEHNRDYSTALINYRKSIRLRDTLYNNEKRFELTTMKHSLEMANQEKEKMQLEFGRQEEEKKRIASENELGSRNQQLLIAVVGVLALVIVTLLLISLYRKKRTETVLAEKDKALAEEKVEQKELLIGEIHHRVKNNLQMISSMLFLEANQTDNEEAKKSLEMASMRLQSIGQLHQSLYSKDSYTGVEISEYISDLADSVQISNSNLRVDHKIEIPRLVVGTDTAITVGLLLNELITNAYKYAFTEGRINILHVEGGVEKEEIQLVIKDSGEDAIDSSRKKSFGLKLVHSLVKQLQGTINFDFDQGNIISIRIRKIQWPNELENDLSAGR